MPIEELQEELSSFPKEIVHRVVSDIRYEGYIVRQQAEIKRQEKTENRKTIVINAQTRKTTNSRKPKNRKPRYYVFLKTEKPSIKRAITSLPPRKPYPTL